MMHTCPSCGFLGRKLRRRNRNATDARLVRFWAQLAAEVRSSQPSVTVYDSRFRQVGDPVTFDQLAEAGVGVRFK
ncbi:hypothetical protein BA059_16705 [Mycolicibacterium sp. (ex Dasyatis americana)]|nr:hypothetical protein BA059_16705 [Mycolicibacterium sp. (ex Dasyatis americana)]